MSQNAPHAEVLFKNIAEFIAQSQMLLREGAIVELSGLDEKVAKLCKEALALSDDDRTKYADLLSELLNSLTVLGEDMRRQQEAIVNEIRFLGSHKKANVAYKSADATDGFAAHIKEEE